MAELEVVQPEISEDEVDVVDELLNPEVRKMIIGTKRTREVEVFPLGYYDQKEIGTKVMTGLAQASEKHGNSAEMEYIAALSQALEDNVPILISKCTNITRKKFMSEVSAGQLMEFITIIMEVNFIEPVKKGTRLFVEMGSLYGANQSLPDSADTTATD